MPYVPNHAFGATETSETEVKTGQVVGEHTVVAYGVLDADANFDSGPPTFHSTDAGTLALWAQVKGSSIFEEVFEDDGTTQVSFDPTLANSRSRVITGAYTAFKLIPASLDVDCVPYLHVTSDPRD